MEEWPLDRAVDRLERLVETVERDRMPVPVREIWVYGDIALGMDPAERLEVYLTKDVLLEDEPDLEASFEETHGIQGVGKTVRGDWAQTHPEFLEANAAGYAAPEHCLAAHLLDELEPIHLEVCNASFEDNVTQRLEGAMATENYEQILDPRGVCLWVDGRRASDAFEKLRAGEYVFPTLAGALEMLGLEDDLAEEAAREATAARQSRSGRTVRADIV